MKPTESEPICVISFEITRIRLGGGPDSRVSFWKAYREALLFNQKTKYRNDRIRICRPYLAALRLNPDEVIYFRKDRLVPERTCQL